MKNKTMKIILLIAAFIPLIAALIFLPKIPNVIPLQFGFSGEVSRWGSKYETLILPIATILTVLLMSKYTNYDQQSEQRKNYKAKLYTTIATLIVLQGASFVTIYIALSNFQTLPKEIVFKIVMIIISLALLIIGNIIPKTQRNKRIGFKIKWTLESDIVWEKTNRLTGKMLFVLGIFGIVSAFVFPAIPALIFLSSMITATVAIGCVYAYKVYNKTNKI